MELSWPFPWTAPSLRDLVAPTLLVSFAVLILLPGCAFPSRLLKFTLPPIRCDPQDMFLEVGNHWTLVLKVNR